MFMHRKKTMAVLLAFVIAATTGFQPQVTFADEKDVPSGTLSSVIKTQISVDETLDTWISGDVVNASGSGTGFIGNTVSEENADPLSRNETGISENEEDAECRDSFFSISAGTVMYGESGSNEEHNLDRIFKPQFVLQGEVLKLDNGETGEGDYRVLYRFFTSREEAWAVSSDKLESVSGQDLSEINAGTEVYAAAVAVNMDDGSVMSEAAMVSFNIAKRPVMVEIERSKDISVSRDDVPEDRMISVSSDDPVFERIKLSVSGTDGEFCREDDPALSSNGFAKDGMEYDLSGVDISENGFARVPVSFDPAPEFDRNYEVEDPSGWVYIEKPVYYITFIANNNGKQARQSYAIPNEIWDTDYSVSVDYLLHHIGRYDEVYPSMNEIIDPEKGEYIYSWRTIVDGSGSVGQSGSLKDIRIYEGCDYILTACIGKNLTDGIYAEILPDVVFDGRAHRVANEYKDGTDYSKKVCDLEVRLYDGRAGTYLEFGKDYSVTYKNNVRASLKYNEDGTYTPAYESDDERPYALIKGKGGYAGFSARVYFEIRPVNFATSSYGKITGLKYIYALKNGKIKEKIKPQVSYRPYLGSWGKNRKSHYADYKMKRGVDYVPKLYKYQVSADAWIEQKNPEPSMITQEGIYLYTAWGMNDYCGVLYGDGYSSYFSTNISGNDYANPAVGYFDGGYYPDTYQFMVMGDIYKDLSNATITIRKPNIAWTGTSHNAVDFGMTVTIGKGAGKRTLTEGKDYRVAYDGTDYWYISGRYKHSETGETIYRRSKSSAYYDGWITTSNKYKVRIYAVEGSGFFGSKASQKGVRIKGISLKSKWFDYKKAYDFTAKRTTPKISVKRRSLGKASIISLSTLGYDSNGYSLYLQKLDADPYSYKINSFCYTYSYEDTSPGSYEIVAYPVGSKIDHSQGFILKFRIKKISLKQALKKGYISISLNAGKYNAGGAYPSVMTVTVKENGNKHCSYTYDLHNGSKAYYSLDGKGGVIIVKGHNNKKAGSSAYLTLKGTKESPFTGAAKVNGSGGRFIYEISPCHYYDEIIEDLDADCYKVENGRRVEYIEDNYRVGEGTLVSVVNDRKVGKGTLNSPSVKLFQTYYRNEKDYDNGRLSLAPVKNEQFLASVSRNSLSGNGGFVQIKTAGTPLISGFEFEDNVFLARPFALYEEEAEIVGAEVSYNGTTYSFPQDSGKPIPFEGSQIRFENGKNAGDGVVSVTLSDGTKLSGGGSFYYGPGAYGYKGYYMVYYGDNIVSGKNKGSFTVRLHLNPATGEYKYGGEKTFRFTIDESEEKKV